jgi:Right handed beta helix region
MTRTATRLSLFVLILLLVTMTASAQATRTWVSGVGDDVNPCSRTAPCKTFAGAISKTASGGEIDVLDPGGYGALTVTKPITIDGTGTLASVLASGFTGFTINSSVPNSNVTLRGLSINGANQTSSPGVNGIRVLNNAGATVNVYIQDCVIFGFNTRGISVETSATANIWVNHTVIRSNAEGIGVIPTGGSVGLHVENSQIDNNSGNGVNLSANTKASFASTSMNHNGVAGLLAVSSTVEANCDRCDMNFNAAGILANSTGGAPTVRLTHCMITGNTTIGVGGTVRGFTSNLIEGNAGNNLITVVGPQ